MNLAERPTSLIISSASPLVVPTSSQFQLNCSVTGIPPPDITWSLDGQTLEADGNRVVVNNGSLSVTDTRESDSGSYHCSASSSAGLASSSLQVLVLDPSVTNVTEAVVRDYVVLECGSEELPAGTPVVWFFNQSRLEPVSDDYIVVEEGHLVVREVWLDNMGVYICQVGGQVNFTHTLNVTGRVHVSI